MHKVLCGGLVAALVLVCGVAAADDTSAAAAPAAKKGEVTVEVVRISLRVPRPNAAIFVQRVPMEATLSRLKQPFVERIGQAAGAEPF